MKVSINVGVGHPTAFTTARKQILVKPVYRLSHWNRMTRGGGSNLRLLSSKQVSQPFQEWHPWRGMVQEWHPWRGIVDGTLKLHPCKPQQHQMVLVKATCPVVFNHWFKQCLEPTSTKLKLKQHPRQIYNVDQSGFPVSWTFSMVLTHRGNKSPQAFLAGTGKENMTMQT